MVVADTFDGARRPDGSAARLIVSGSGGFLGRAIVAQARALGFDVIPVTREQADQKDPAAMVALLRRFPAEYAIDAAGVLPGASGDVLSNVLLTQGWLEAVSQVEHPPRLVLVGSAAIYGQGAAKERATREDDPFLPLTDYGRAKLAALELGQRAHEDRGLDVQTGIIFNLMGKGQPAHLAPQVFIDQALAAQGRGIKAGAVDTVRDFMDIEDAAVALIAMAYRGAPGAIMNVATGTPTRIRNVLEALSDRFRLPWTAEESTAQARGVDVCYGDPARLYAQTGWRPSYDFATALSRAIGTSGATQQERKGTA